MVPRRAITSINSRRVKPQDPEWSEEVLRGLGEASFKGGRVSTPDLASGLLKDLASELISGLAPDMSEDMPKDPEDLSGPDLLGPELLGDEQQIILDPLSKVSGYFGGVEQAKPALNRTI